MKRRIILLAVAAALFLSACGAARELPASWESDWTVICPVLAAEPFDGYTLHEKNDALYLSGIYYATWVTGSAQSHINEDGEEAEIFDAQIYVIVQEYRDSDSAKSGLSQWITWEKQTFEAGDSFEADCGGQTYSILPLHRSAETNPYSHGAAAFTAWNNWAICVEFLGTDDYDAEIAHQLEAFLNGFHFSQ